MVNFVGAGCGSPDLITLRGHRLISEADVIIYAGSLVNPELLDFARKDCEIYNSAYMNLDEVIEVMKNAERDGKMTVRLHTGDPSVYGAIREQMDRLKVLEIPYEICPGVSSFCGAAAALKAEYTLPDVSQTVIIYTNGRKNSRTTEGGYFRTCKAWSDNGCFFKYRYAGGAFPKAYFRRIQRRNSGGYRL